MDAAKLPRYFYFRIHSKKSMTIEVEDASDVDVAEVVRCEDCVEWEPGTIDEKDNFNPPMCKWLKQPMHAADYCSYGKRKETPQ